MIDCRYLVLVPSTVRLSNYLDPINYGKQKEYDRYEELPAYSGGGDYDRGSI